MPIVQPYKKSSTRTISTCLQDLILTVPDRTDPVHRRKQLQAFPPNFIHSLDASHMILSALECDEKGLTFAAVHDSFWTHAADVDVMNDVLRDAFIRIHSEDVIGRLAAEFEARYKGCVYLAKVNQGTDVAKKIAEFRKENRMSLRDELLTEKKRMELLHSENPEDVEKGKSMVTPASIYEEMSAAQDLVEPDESNETTFGVIPSEEQKAVDALESKTSKKKLAEAKAVLEAAEEGSEAEAKADDIQPESSDDRLVSLIGTQQFALETAPKAPRKSAPSTIQFWLPLTFPKIPEKGDFDVRRLKGSQYFFS